MCAVVLVCVFALGVAAADAAAAVAHVVSVVGSVVAYDAAALSW